MTLQWMALLACLALSVLRNQSFAQNFAPAVDYATQTQPTGIAKGDFNGDGNLDLIVTNAAPTSLSLFLGNGDGTFKPAITIPVTIGFPLSVTAADFKGDGNVDIAVCSATSGLLQVLFGNGDGTFQPPITFPIPGLPPNPAGLNSVVQISSPDFNDDKKPDLASATSNGVAVFLNDGSGNFSFAGYAFSGQVIQNLAVADFNRDGRPDLVVNTDAGTTLLSLGNGDGTFQSPSTLPFTTQSPAGIAVADINKDGLLDVVVDDFGLASGAPGSIQIALQQPDGTFLPAATLTSIVHPNGIITGDFDGDGIIDIAALSGASSGEPSNVVIFPGRGQGDFLAPNQFPVSSGPTQLVAASLSNTVALDIVTTNIIANTISVLVNHGANTLALTSSVNPSAVFQSVTLTATVKPEFPGSGTRSGSVIFADGSKTLGTASINSSGSGSLTTTFTGAGSHSLVAVFGGNSSFVGGSSATLTQAVTKAVPTVSLASSVDPSAFGQLVGLTVTVSTVGAGAPATGRVNLVSGGSVILNGVLDNTGRIVLNTSSLPIGANVITAQYAGDVNYTAANSLPLTQTVNKSATTTSITEVPNPSVFGQAVVISATVTASGGGSGVPSGTVSFSDGGDPLGTVPLDGNGKASITANSFAVGAHIITAAYSGDSNFLASSSDASPQTVNRSSTTTALSGGPNPSVFGQAVVFAATVAASGSGSGVPSGSVSFSDGGNSIGSATLDTTGKAAITVSSLVAGSHNISVSYHGDINFLASSAAGSQTVNKSPTATTLAVNPNPSVFGQGVALNAVVTSSGAGSGTPSGTVSFTDNGALMGTAVLDKAGKATFTVASLGVGSHNMAANYGGDANFISSSASGAGGVTQVVNQSSTLATLASSADPSVFGQTITLTITVAASGGGSGIPTGTATLSDGATFLGSVTLDSTGKATLAFSSLAVGDHSLTASYSGSVNYLASSSTRILQTVNKNTVAITIVSSPNPSTFGQGIAFTAQVAPAQPGGALGTAVPTGTLSLTDGGVVLAAGPLNGSGKLTITTSALAVGAHNLLATYTGDANFVEGSSSPYTHTVGKAQTATSLISSMNPTTNFSPFTLTATVTSAPGVPSGSVTFLDGTQAIGSSIVDNGGNAALRVVNLPAGVHNLNALYNGDANFSGSQSPSVREMVVDSHSTVTVVSSTNPQIVTEAVTFVATVTPALGGQATNGIISFSDGKQILTTVPVSDSTASFTTRTLAIGNHQIVATFQAGSLPGPFDGASLALVQSINRDLPIIIIGGNGQDFTVSIQQPTAQISVGSTFSTQVILTPVNGLKGSVTMLCSGAPTASTCSINSDASTFDGKNPITATLVITTTGTPISSAATVSSMEMRRPNLYPGLALGLLPVFFSCLLVQGSGKKRRKLIGLTMLTALLAGCGGTRFETKTLIANTPPGTYTIHVQSQSGTVVHDGQILLTVK